MTPEQTTDTIRAIQRAIREAMPFASIIYIDAPTMYAIGGLPWAHRPSSAPGTFMGVKLAPNSSRVTGWAVGVPCPVCDPPTPINGFEALAMNATYRIERRDGRNHMVCNTCDNTDHRIVAHSDDWKRS